jgi:hypothetical protein
LWFCLRFACQIPTLCQRLGCSILMCQRKQHGALATPDSIRQPTVVAGETPVSISTILEFQEH